MRWRILNDYAAECENGIRVSKAKLWGDVVYTVWWKAESGDLKTVHGYTEGPSLHGKDAWPRARAIAEAGRNSAANPT